MSALSLPDWVAHPLNRLWGLLQQEAELPTDASSLATWLYGAWYLGPSSPPPQLRESPARLVAQLRVSLGADSSFEEGWTVVEPRDDLGVGTIEVTNGQLRKIVPPVDYVVSGKPFSRPESGSPVRVTARIDSVDQGFYRTWSPEWSFRNAAPLVRAYWSVPEQHIVDVGATIALGLADSPPWLFKVGVDYGARGRPDGLVVYLRTSDLPEFKPILRRIWGELNHLLAGGYPAFTRPVAKGLAVAEDPDGEESFGEQRCRLVAESLLPNFPGSLEELTERLALAFESEGLDLRAPDRRQPLQGTKS